ncbi:MAG: response regulator transcription factor [Rubrobacteraceae bacterium]
MKEAIRILITDDHPVVRAGLEGMLSRQPDMEVVGEAGDGTDGVRMAEQLRPDVVLMDLRMPEMDGVAATQEIKAKNPETQVLVLTTYDSDADILRAVEAGATGYLLKDAPREELYEAVRAAAQGKVLFAPAVADKLMRRIREPRRDTLSQREIEVLGFVRKGLSNKEIARSLHVSEATIKTHLIHTFRKLGVDDRTAAVSVALEKGILHLGN